MELTALKDLFFVGSADTVDAFCNGLKPRCIKVSEKFQTLRTEYGEEKVLYNSEDDTYITPHMEVYRLDHFLNELQPAETFKEIKVNELQAVKDEGARYRTFKYVLSDKALKSQEFFVEDYANKGLYLFRYNENTLILDDEFFIDRRETEKFDVFDKKVWHWDCVTTCFTELPEQNVYLKENITTVANANVTKNGVFYPVLFVRKDEVDRNPYTYWKCPVCGQVYSRASFGDDEPSCSCMDVEIYDYHDWGGEYTPVRSEHDSDDEKMYFGTEVETVGSSSNKCFIAPYQDYWHLEHDGSIDGDGFEMISAPMTWKALAEHKNDFANMFSELREAGQSGDDASCGMHVHVSRAAFKSESAIWRAVAIVNRLQDCFFAFSRRLNSGNEYCRYNRLYSHFTYEDVEKCDNDRYVAVNLTDDDTVEFRIFASTLDIDEYFASVEIVKKVVEYANTDKRVISFNDLLLGTEYAAKFVDGRGKSYFHCEYKCDFTYADAIRYMKEVERNRNDFQKYLESFCKYAGLSGKLSDDGSFVVRPVQSSSDSATSEVE